MRHVTSLFFESSAHLPGGAPRWLYSRIASPARFIHIQIYITGWDGQRYRGESDAQHSRAGATSDTEDVRQSSGVGHTQQRDYGMQGSPCVCRQNYVRRES